MYDKRILINFLTFMCILNEENKQNIYKMFWNKWMKHVSFANLLILHSVANVININTLSASWVNLSWNFKDFLIFSLIPSKNESWKIYNIERLSIQGIRIFNFKIK